MREHELIALAAPPTLAVIRAIRPDQLTAPTPCAEYDVRDLIDHMVHWGPSLIRASRQPAAAPQPAADTHSGAEAGPGGDAHSGGDAESGDAHSGGDAESGREALERQIGELVAAWSVPAAWEGVTSMGGPHEMPASMIGAMATGEVVVHGWDLARATGQQVSWDETLIEFLYDEVAKTAELGREMRAYGEEFPVPRTAPTLDRMLGLTGRDPAWRRPA